MSKVEKIINEYIDSLVCSIKDQSKHKLFREYYTNEINKGNRKIEISKSLFFELRDENEDLKKFTVKDGGETAHFRIRAKGLNCNYEQYNRIGIYTPRKGYYKIIKRQLINNEAYFDAFFDTKEPYNFYEELVRIKEQPFYNLISEKPRSTINENDVVHVFEDTEVINGSYKVHWCILKESTTEDESIDDDWLRDIADSNDPELMNDAYWNLD